MTEELSELDVGETFSLGSEFDGLERPSARLSDP